MMAVDAQKFQSEALSAQQHVAALRKDVAGAETAVADVARLKVCCALLYHTYLNVYCRPKPRSRTNCAPLPNARLSNWYARISKYKQRLIVVV
jgi:hypothetical protein